jgi:hypothetical protein
MKIPEAPRPLRPPSPRVLHNYLYQYNDVETILAEYNGGSLNAGYFRANAEKLAGETRDYVPRVIAVYERLGRDLGRVAPLPSARGTWSVANPEAVSRTAAAGHKLPGRAGRIGDE